MICQWGYNQIMIVISVDKTNRENVMNDCMRETDDVASKRKVCAEMRELLFRANEIVNEVHEYCPLLDCYLVG
jgi:hypothetical protein